VSARFFRSEPAPPEGKPMPPEGKPMPLRGNANTLRCKRMPLEGKSMPCRGKRMPRGGRALPLESKPMLRNANRCLPEACGTQLLARTATFYVKSSPRGEQGEPVAAAKKRTYYPPKTFDDDLTGLVNLYGQKKWSFSNIDIKVLGKDATA